MLEKIRQIYTSIYNYFSIRRRLFIFIIIGILIIGIFFFFLFSKKESIPQINDEPILEKESVEEEPKKKTIKIDIKGAVVTPGVYELEEEDTVFDAIEKSGGLLESADTSTINLSKQVFNEMVIIIYTKEEIKEMRKGTTTVKYIEKECVCPKLENNACIESENKVTNEENNDKEPIQNTGKVSINKATLQELMTLSGIGEAKAQDIIDYRNQNGPFIKIEDLMKVSGIGTKTFEKIKDRLTL